MKYILMNEKLAIEKGIINAKHHFRKEGELVLFKRDILTFWEQQSGNTTDEFGELTTPEALKTTEKWKL
ncbi:hypothetical protein [Flavobacterium sp. NKUCC04_CG]|uniref:hypothetical protein n=1 Tax=Flavobacterium sp. NKUCC04_CG TaxID=2842121 RepID=UPI001C5AE8D1|nr:hypothetical protein [Flavobacterium sp. NKUCC04_CG]MBW3519526.1 hypothetical protein [Flavobacterium sp. NKUCC04_CG]